MKVGMTSTGSGKGPVANCCIHSNELSCSIKDRTFLDQLTISFSKGALLHSLLVIKGVHALTQVPEVATTMRIHTNKLAQFRKCVILVLLPVNSLH